MTANLYLPNPLPKEKLPAILYQCGHANMKRDGNKSAYKRIRAGNEYQLVTVAEPYGMEAYQAIDEFTGSQAGRRHGQEDVGKARMESLARRWQTVPAIAATADMYRFQEPRLLRHDRPASE